ASDRFPGDPPAQRQHRIGIDRQNPVEARAQLASSIGRVAAIDRERKAVGDQPRLGIVGRVAVLRLDSRVGRDAAVRRSEAVAAFEPPAVGLRVEGGGQGGESGAPTGGRPVGGEGEGRGKVGRTPPGRTVDAGLEGIALAAAQALRQLQSVPAPLSRRNKMNVGERTTDAFSGKTLPRKVAAAALLYFTLVPPSYAEA